VHERLTAYGERAEAKISSKRSAAAAAQHARDAEDPFAPAITRAGAASRPSDPLRTAQLLHKDAGERSVVRDCTK
jgi:hypothetical protein